MIIYDRIVLLWAGTSSPGRGFSSIQGLVSGKAVNESILSESDLVQAQLMKIQVESSSSS
jgi:hypothetical protein